MSIAPVSVVIPTFRDGDALRRALASVARQMLRPAQVIVVDDAGGDERVVGICAAAEIGHVELVRLPRNIGPGGARNAGIAAASQPFLAFLDADDEWHPNKLEIQMALMQSDTRPSFSAHLKGFSGAAWPDLGDGHAPEMIRRWPILLSNLAPISTVIIRRDEIHHQFPLDYAGEDYAFVTANLLCGARGVKINETLARADKPAFGAGGLSGRLHAMQLGEMRTHFRLWRNRLIRGWEYAALVPWTLVKYLRRLLLVLLRRLSEPAA